MSKDGSMICCRDKVSRHKTIGRECASVRHSHAINNGLSVACKCAAGIGRAGIGIVLCLPDIIPIRSIQACHIGITLKMSSVSVRKRFRR